VMNDGAAGSTADLAAETTNRTGLDLEFGSGVSWTSGNRTDVGTARGMRRCTLTELGRARRR